MKACSYFCPICHDVAKDTEFVTTDCGHKFHVVCLDTWLREHNSCPMCRTDIHQHNSTFNTSIRTSNKLIMIAMTPPDNAICLPNTYQECMSKINEMLLNQGPVRVYFDCTYGIPSLRLLKLINQNVICRYFDDVPTLFINHFQIYLFNPTPSYLSELRPHVSLAPPQ